MFLTESKCQSSSFTPKKVMKLQLNEERLRGNINRFDTSKKSLVLNFIDKASTTENTPTLVFKGVHRVLIDGSSEWLIEPLNTKTFQALRLGITSPEKEKETFIANIAPNFSSPEEMLRVVFAHYKVEGHKEKLAIFSKSLGHSSEQPEQLIVINKQETNESKIVRRLSFNSPLSEQPKEAAIVEQAILTGKHQTEKSESETKTIKKIEYTRDNLSKLLVFIKEGFKRNQLESINEKLKELAPDYVPLKAGQLSMFSNYKKYSDKYKIYDYNSLWDLLLKAFSDRYQQAVAEGVFDEELV